MNKTLTVYTDGAAIGKSGLGGLAIAWKEEGEHRTIVEGAVSTTRRRMALKAVKRVLQKFPTDRDIIIYARSEYVVKGINHRLDEWEESDWRSKGKPILDRDLWKAVAKLMKARTGSTICYWPRARDGVSMMEFVTRLAENKARAFDRGLG